MSAAYSEAFGPLTTSTVVVYGATVGMDTSALGCAFLAAVAAWLAASWVLYVSAVTVVGTAGFVAQLGATTSSCDCWRPLPTYAAPVTVCLEQASRPAFFKIASPVEAPCAGF